MELIPRLAEAVKAIQSKTALRPVIGLVLGSGLGAFARSLEKPTVIPYGQIPHFPVSTAIGHSGELVIGTTQGVPVAVMAGRVHLYEGYSAEQVAFPIRVLARMGVNTMIMTNAAGSVNVNYKPVELLLQHPGRHVRDARDAQDAHPHVAGGEDLGHRRHPHRVGPHHARHLDRRHSKRDHRGSCP